MKILIVDDDRANRVLLTNVFENRGFEVSSACNGQEGLEIARSYRPDVIISDIMMPVMDGFQLCRQVKQDMQLKDIPFVFYSAAYTENDDETFGLSLGAAAYISKPVEPSYLVEKVNQIIKAGTKNKQEQPDEKDYLTMYSRRLVNKLEDKVLELEEANEKLELAYDELKTLDILKDNIISNITHELRTPLMHVSGYLEFALNETDSEKRRGFLEKSIEALKREDKLVINLVETATAEKGMLEPFIDTLDLEKVISASVVDMNPKRLIYDINIQVSCTGNMTIQGDYYQLKHVMTNLIDNAIKFNHKEGEVEILAQEMDDHVQISIRDSGIGIPEDKLDKVFDKLYQIESDTNRRYGGTGIGLTIARHIVELHGGKIWVTSKEGAGSTFYFTLPKQNNVGDKTG